MKKNNQKEIEKIYGKEKTSSGCKKVLPTAIVFFVFLIISLTTVTITTLDGISTNNKSFEDIFIKFDDEIVQQYIEVKSNSNDLSNAKQKLNDVGLATLSNVFNKQNLENNTEFPTSDLILTRSELQELTILSYYSHYGKGTTIYEMSLAKTEEDNIYNFRVICKDDFDFSKYGINIGKTLYFKLNFNIDLTTNKATLDNYTILNIKDDAFNSKNKKIDANMNNEFASYMFLLENETYFTKQLNYSSYKFENDMIVFSIM